MKADFGYETLSMVLAWMPWKEVPSSSFFCGCWTLSSCWIKKKISSTSTKRDWFYVPQLRLQALIEVVLYSVFIELFGLEGTFKGHLVQPTCNEQGCLQLDKVAQRKSCLMWPWMFPGMGHLPPLWATCSSVLPHPHDKIFFSFYLV